MAMARLVVIDDEMPLLRALTIGLKARGYEIFGARTGADGLAEVALRVPDVVVLDLGLPDIDGVEVCRRIRQWSDVPVVVLSAHGSEARKVEALDEGADDFVDKPFGMAELEARLRVALRHRAKAGEGADEPEIQVGPILIEVPARRVTVEGGEVDLTPREFDLLVYLARQVGRVVTHHVLLESVWGDAFGSEARARVYVSRLRRKLGPSGAKLLKTLPGVGYQLLDETPAR